MKKLMKNTFGAICLVACTFSTANANELNSSLLLLQQQWAKVNYQQEGDTQEQGYEKLIVELEKLVQQYPNSAEVKIWLGIAKSSFAGAKGGLGALSLAKQARNLFQQALKIDSSALEGSAYTSLGTLYAKVPGWPIGFGDEEKAKELMEKALVINPKGIDANFFYGEYLFEEGEYQQAQQYLLTAQQATPRADRPLADSGRQQEVSQLLAKIEKKLAKR